MGCCASSQKPPELRLPLVQKVKKLLMISGNGEKVRNGESGFIELATKGENRKKCVSSEGLWQRDESFGSKDEAFFDSLACLDSDTDDDFQSVRGDFTPSRNNSLNYLGSAPETPTPVSMVDTMSDAAMQPSPKMKLVDLFRETNEQDGNVNGTSQSIESPSINQEKASDRKPEDGGKSGLLPLKSAISVSVQSDIYSTDNGETTPDDMDIKRGEKGKASKDGQCCMPGLHPDLSFNDKMKLSTPIPMIETNVTRRLIGDNFQLSANRTMVV